MSRGTFLGGGPSPGVLRAARGGRDFRTEPPCHPVQACTALWYKRRRGDTDACETIAVRRRMEQNNPHRKPQAKRREREPPRAVPVFCGRLTSPPRAPQAWGRFAALFGPPPGPAKSAPPHDGTGPRFGTYSRAMGWPCSTRSPLLCSRTMPAPKSIRLSLVSRPAPSSTAARPQPSASKRVIYPPWVRRFPRRPGRMVNFSGFVI